MSLSMGSQKQKGSSSQKQEPWAPTIPYLQDFLGSVGNLAGSLGEGATGAQDAAAGQLKDIYGAGNKYSGMLGDLASDTLTGVDSQSGMAKDAYSTLQSQLTPYASGQYLDFNSNPHLQQMLSTVGDSVQERINAQFAGAGRDLSGMNQSAIGRGVTQAQLPLLMEHFNQQQQNQMNAANALYGAGTGTAQVAQGLDASALAGRAGGIPAAEAATNAEMWGPQGIFNLEQLMQELPAQNLGMLSNLLLPVAQLGQQQTGTSKSSGTSFGVGAKLLSDERLKEDLQQIGTLADGTPIYRFRYKGEDTTRIGLSAQDLEEVTPEAVSEYDAPSAGTDTGTVKYVDMDAATRRAADMVAQGGEPGAVGGYPALPPPMPRPMLDEEPWMRAA
jgi:hypothetical protein